MANKIIITVLILSAVVLSALIGYNRYKKNNDSSAQVSQSPSSISDQDRRTLFETLPKQDASQSAKIEHFKLAEKLAVAAEYLDIAGCNPNPLVIKVKSGTQFKLRNNSEESREIGFDKDTIFKVGPNAQTSIKAEFEHGPGLYGYGCNDPAHGGTVGFILVLP